MRPPPLLWPASRLLRWAVLLCGLLEAPLRVHGYTTGRTSQDTETSQLAERRAQEECGNVADLSKLNRAAGLDVLRDTVGGRSILRESLVEASSLSDLRSKLQGKADAGWIIATAGSLLFSLVLGLVWLACCWTACPCCRCCRCCVAQRKTSLWLRAVVLVLLVFAFFGMLVCAFLAYGGKGDIEDGRNTMVCSAARVLNTTLNGDVQSRFLGTLPMLDEMTVLRSVLDDNSSFVSYVSGLVDSTVEIQRATVLAEQTAALLAAMLAEPANLNPAPAEASRRSLHRCELCASLSAPAAELSTQLAGGAATALAATRHEIDRQFGPASRASLRRTFDSAFSPMRDASNTVRDLASIFLREEVTSKLDLAIAICSGLIIGISVVVFLLAGCGCRAGALLATQELDCEKEFMDAANPWHPAIAPWACCGWCWAWLYAFLVFLVGGLFSVLAVPLADTCLLLRDMDGQLFRDVLPATGLQFDTGGSSLQMLSEVVDSCFSLQSQATNTSLMDVLYIEEAGSRTTLRQKLQGETASLLERQFAEVNARATTPTGSSLMASQNMVSMLALLRDTPADASIVAQPEVQRHAVYSGLFLDPRGQAAGVQAAVGSSLACSDGGSSLGLVNFTARVQGFTSSPSVATSPPIPCANAGRVVCNRDPVTGSTSTCPVIGSDTCSACQAANNFLDLKAELLGLATYRCDVLQTSSGADCDPRDMLKVGGAWLNDCVQADGNGSFFAQVKPKTCSLPQFTAYMSDWATRLTQVFTRLDEAVPVVQGSIAVSLQDTIARDILRPVDRLASSSQCGFFQAEYERLLDGLCFQFAVGLRDVAWAYLWNGSFVVLFVFVCYGIWRRALDNRNEWIRDHSLKEEEVVTIVPMDTSVLPVAPGSTEPWTEPVRTFVPTPDSPAKKKARPPPLEVVDFPQPAPIKDTLPEPESPPPLPGGIV